MFGVGKKRETVGLDIGASSVKAVQLRKGRGGHELVRFGIAPLHPETIVDEPARWEITLYLAKESPAPEATTDVTPRRCQRFKARPAERFLWTHSAEGGGPAIQSGEAAADGAGLVTVPVLRLTAARSRVKIERKP